ncbi:MAG: methyltransferase [bacterium]|nr:methyltransferase [bacterium]
MEVGQIAPPAHELQFNTHLRGREFHFTTTWGLFHPKGVDAGTALLLERLVVTDDATCLDLGCGWGPIGLTLAHLAPAGQVHMVDKDFVAVDYAQRNAAANGCGNARAYLSNGFSHVPAAQRFDLVVSNIPAKAGGELLQYWMTETHRRLHPGGALWVVTVAGLKDYMKRVLGETFGNHRKVKQSGTHVVTMAVRS